MLRFLALTWAGRAVAGLLVIALAGATLAAPRFTAAAPVAAVRTATVARGNVTQTVTVSGSVNAAAQVKVAFKPTGRISEILVKVGDAVTAGQPLARLDPLDLQFAVKQAEVNRLSAQAKLDQTTAGASAEDIALAKNSVDTAEKTLAETRRGTANDLAAAQQSFTKLKAAYASDQNAFSLLATAVASDVELYARSLDSMRSILSQATIDTAVRSTADMTTAKTAIGQADSALVNAQAVASGQLNATLIEWKAARDNVISSWLQFDDAVLRGTDTSGATSGYRSAQTAYATAAQRLTAALDSVAASVSSASANITTAQNSLNTATSRTDYELDRVRGTLTGFQTTAATESQRATAIRNKVSQAGTSLATVTDAVGGSYVNAQQAAETAKQKAAQAVNAQENALRSAELSFQKTTATPKQTDIALAYASVQLADLSLEKARSDLAGATLRSPAAGVVAQVANQVGEAPANPFAVVAMTATIVLHGTIGEADVAKLKLGQVATLVVDAIGSSTRLTGKVTALDPVATIQQGVPVFGVDVAIDRPDPAVRPGMTGTATVIIANKQGVLTVPNLAIRTVSGQRVVQVMRGGAPAETQARFGIGNDTVTEVVSGLEEGDAVVLPTPRAPAGQQPGGPLRVGGPGPQQVPFR